MSIERKDEVFLEMEKRDEDQILKEMRGELIEEFVYSIQLRGEQVTNLSYAGVKEAMRRRGNLQILDVRTEETEEEIRALIRVRDLDNRIDVVGASSAERDKPFAYTLAVNKAERNAFAKLIPAKWYATLIQDWLQKHRPGAKPSATQPAQPWKPEVPITKDTLKESTVRQFPLVQGLSAVGMVNVFEDGSEASIVPEGQVYAGDPAFTGFLFPRVLDAMTEKHPGMSYHVVEGEDGTLTAIVIRGKLEEKQVKELCNAARWAFSKALDRER